MTNKPDPKAVEAEQEFENRLVKHYWAECLNTKTNEINLNRVDPSSDFSVIPTNTRGKIDLQVGELRDIIREVIKQTLKRQKALS